MYNKKKYGVAGVIIAIIVLIILFTLTNIQNSNANSKWTYIFKK